MDTTSPTSTLGPRASPRTRPDAANAAEGASPAVIGSYRVLRLIGRGGMGEVYEVVDERLGRRAALKRIATHRQGDAEARARFWREARSLAAVRHPGLVTVYEIGEDPAAGLFIAMELVDGVPLSRLFEVGHALPIGLALALVAQAAEALGAAHRAGITHRDVKPANLIVDVDAKAGGRLRVVDFGLARRMSDEGDELTREGAAIGTPSWMAPEQLAGEGGAAIGPPTDVFALGVLSFRALTGVHPFVRESAGATALAIAGGLRPALRALRPEVPAALAEVVERALSVDPKARYPDGAALAEALAEAARGFEEERAPALGDELAALVERTRSAEGPRPMLPSTPAEAAVPGGLAGSLEERRGEAVPGGWRRGARLWGLVAALGLGGLGVFALVGAEPTAPGGSGVGVGNTAGPTGAQMGDGKDLLTEKIGLGLRSESGAGVVEGRVRDGGVQNTSGAVAGELVLPPRPAILVAGFLAEPDAAADAAVVAEVMRVRLGELEGLSTVPSMVAETILVEPGAMGPGVEPTRLWKSDRGPGHVDLLVRGRFGRRGDELALTLELVETRSGRELARTALTTRDGSGAVVGLAEAAEAWLGARLGVAAPGSRARLSRDAESWTALIAAKTAARGADVGRAREHLSWALSRDGRFGLARAEELKILRMEGRSAELVAAGEALLSDAEALPPAERGLVEGLVMLGRGESEAALRSLHEVAERWPWEVDAALVLMGIYAKDPVLHDLDEVEKLARAVLAVGPRNETAASRLVRALGTRGRGEDARALYERLGIDREDPELFDVWAEIDLFSGRFDAAARGFRVALEREPGNVYVEHMVIASELLGGRCEEAATAALDRIERVTRLGRDSLLDWTYSLAVQALVCARAWESLDGVLARWGAHGRSGMLQATLMRDRAALARALSMAPGEPREREVERLERGWQEAVEAEATPGELVQAMIGLYVRVGRDAELLSRLLARARARALDVAVPAPERLGWRYLERALTARVALVEGRPTEEVRAAYERAVLPLAEVEGEGEATARVEGLGRLAEALEVLGEVEAARAVWAEVAATGYPRLWASDVWVVARARAGSDGGGP